MNLKQILLTSLMFIAASGTGFSQKALELKSPNGAIKIALTVTDKIRYAVSYNTDELLTNNSLSFELKNDPSGKIPKLISSKASSGTNTIKPYIPLKFSTVNSTYNKLLLTFKGNYAVEFRAFDDGIAYRFITSKKGDIEILNEEATLNFPSSYDLHVQQPGSFKTAYEENYSTVKSSDWKSKMTTLPMLIDTKKQYKILISESDLSDYPCLFFKSNGQNGVSATFPKAPLEFGDDGDRSLKIIKEKPELFQVRFDDVRVNMLKTFPYLIHYTIYGDIIVIKAILHSSRNSKLNRF